MLTAAGACNWHRRPETLASPTPLQLPTYGVVIVHAGLVPGVPLERQALFDMEKM